MRHRPSRQAVLAVRAVKAGVTAVVAGVAIVLTLGGATARPADGPSREPGTSTRPPVESALLDARCTDAAGETIVRTPRGETRVVSFEHGWKVYRGERPGTLVAVCPD